jgi:ABC-type Na+ efflux pump permease subunit
MRWRKVAVVASTEFNNAVRTRAFLVSLLMLPLIYGLAILIQVFANRADTETRPFAVVDHTGVLFPDIESQAKTYNEIVASKDGKLVAPRFEPSNATDEKRPTPEILYDLSQRVREGKLFAFVEIPADVIDPEKTGPNAKEQVKLRYHTNTPTDMGLPRWLEGIINTQVQSQRFKEAGLDAAKVAKVMTRVDSETLGLLDRAQATAPTTGASPASPATASSGISQAKQVDPIRTFAPPIALVAVMFIVIMSTTPQLMQTVLEEKLSKISEVLLGSITPFELMLGKLLGNLGVALLLAGLYVGAAYGVAARYGYGDILPPALIAYSVLFIVLGVMLFGSLFMAVGSACNDMKDAQSLMFPVMMLALLPTFFWTVVLSKPSSPISVGISLFPPATPFLMLMRLALSPAPPPWQVGLSVVLTTLTAILCVWASAKIFRVGLLMTGKAPSFAELAKWIVAK